MAQAARGLPGRARIHYNLGLLLQMLQKDTEAEESLQRAIELDPASLDFLYALADFYLKRNRREDARKIAERMIVLHPQSDVGKRFLNFIGKRP
jgi:tetratricopeptide (TPR) repeat protein